MKPFIGALLVLAVLASAAWFRKEHAPIGQKQLITPTIPGVQNLEALWEAEAVARKAAEQAREEAERTWKIATQIRERDGIIDPTPHRNSEPASRSGDPNHLKAYLAAKQLYLKANSESARMGDLASEARWKAADEERKPSAAARAKADQRYNAAAALRQKFEIIDPDPESETHPSSLSGNPDDLNAYLAAKREYLKAKAERDQFENRAFYSVAKLKP